MTSKELEGFLAYCAEHAGLAADQTVAAVLPLFRQVHVWHEAGLVAQLNDLDDLIVDAAHRLQLSGQGEAPEKNRAGIAELEAPKAVVDIVGRATHSFDADDGGHTTVSSDVITADQRVQEPCYVVGYRSWEELVGHHDQLTDIHLLGLVLATVACGFDFRDGKDLDTFALHRTNLFRLRPDLHPVLARVIVDMTDLRRHKRIQDLASVIETLDTYRDQPVDFDLNRIAGARSGSMLSRRQSIQVALRDQLFDLSRRNRLLHYVPSQQSLNLTMASFPLQLHLDSVKADQLLTWSDRLGKSLAGRKPLDLVSALRFEDAPYAPPVLDKLISSARRDKAEYGMSSLRLVVCFLRWHNFKDVKEERIHSPLLLLPVEIRKKRGVRDSYLLEATSGIAEVNPVLRYQLNRVYGLELPESIDLESQSVDDFHGDLAARINASERAVVLEKIDRPRIEMVREQARIRVDRYVRNQRRSGARSSGRTLPYSYSAVDFRPLGLQTFLAKVKPAMSPLRTVVGAQSVAHEQFFAASAEKKSPSSVIQSERDTYVVTQGSEANPYVWDFDLCALTVANFNYRNMTLVRDYAELITTDQPSDAFDRLFSLDAKPIESVAPELSIAEQNIVVAADASQLKAVAKSRTGSSFIVQGPPGTGKSQTITNLIADYVRRGQRVLFVCEKRAAIDVVYARLRQSGLDELCCLIHDSQADKKEFVQGLKATYNHWLEAPQELQHAEEARQSLVIRMEQRLSMLERFDQVMAGGLPELGMTVRQLIERLVELRHATYRADESLGLTLPSYPSWREHRPTLERLSAALQVEGQQHRLALHPLRFLAAPVVASQNTSELHRQAVEALPLHRAFEASLRPLVDDVDALTVSEALEVRGLANLAHQLLERNQLSALDRQSPAAAELHRRAGQIELLRQVENEAVERAHGWTQPPVGDEALQALEIARSHEQSFWKFLNGSWRTVSKLVNERYNFGGHAIKPTATQVLERLVAAQGATRQRELAEADATAAFGIPDVVEASQRLSALDHRDKQGLGAVVDRLLSVSDAKALTQSVVESSTRVDRLGLIAGQLFAQPTMMTIAQLTDTLSFLSESPNLLSALCPLLADVLASPPEISAMALRLPVEADSMEFVVAGAAVEQVLARDRSIDQFDERRLAETIDGLLDDLGGLFDANALAIRAGVRRRFVEHTTLSNTSATQLNVDQKAFKKSFMTGRRQLEHEFGKSMRYKSIRELADGESGQVVMDLRPVWLMSPLSVSDTLPLSPDLFDVVIFDEASQIPLEEAIPALYRSHQTIVVGDQMQLPPTQFFSKSQPGADAEDESEEMFGVTLDADSFLAQADSALTSTLLSWHYRSRSEALIAFSNAAFYGDRLATIPDKTLPSNDLEPIEVADPQEAAPRGCESLLGRSISFHHTNGVYDSRRNLVEAAYIAQLVRQLLVRNTGNSLGVVAFSEAQQSAIEEALEKLAKDDPAFARLYEEEQIREHDGQYNGLFVKNLENVQGDERDIILLSICYAPNAGGRMVMNFGPINQKGGEKRLNVIFSRAKHHMVVVSSIKHTAITNDFNDGANALRRFLQFAEATSVGDVAAADVALRQIGGERTKSFSTGARPAPDNVVVNQIAERLRAAGHSVDLNVGQSRFRCDLAIRAGDDRRYSVAVLLDTSERASAAATAERSVSHPLILQAFGWKVCHVLVKDWYRDPDKVLRDVTNSITASQ